MPRALFVDDSAYFEDLMRDAGGEGWLFARTDDEALAAMTAGDGVDVVAIAVDSPNLSGLGLFHRLKDARLRVPRIAIVASPDLAAIRQAMNQGAADFLVKPVAPHDLTATLEKVFVETERRRAAWKNEAHLAAIRREIEVAAEIQRRILPEDAPVGHALDLHARMRPARNMGGDFYDYFRLGRGRVALVVADVSGKGVPAAFFMAVVRTLVRASAALTATPAACLAQVNGLLCGHHVPGMFVSLFYAVLDTRTGALAYANGGHPPPFVIRADGRIEALTGGPGTVLGVDAGLPYAEDATVLAPGEALVLYTDGLTEAFDSERRQFSEQRLLACLGGADARAITDAIFAALAAHAGDAPQSDDVTTLVARRPV